MRPSSPFPLPGLRSAPAAALALVVLGASSAPAVALGEGGPSAGASWVILPSEDVIYRYYPKYQQDHGIAGFAEINCRIRNRRDLDQCLIKSETPDANGFGAAAVKLAEAEFHVLPEVISGAEPNATVNIRVSFTPKDPAEAEAAAAKAAPATAAAGADDPAAVIAWGEAVQRLDWRYAAPARGQITFWKASSRISPTAVRGAVRYEYFAPASAPAGAVRSSVVDYEFDCAGHAYRPLAVTTYVQPNLTGPATALSGPAAAAQALVPGSVLEDAASRVCQFDAGGGTAKMSATSASPSKQ